MTLVNRSYRNDISVISLDNNYQYKMFLRYSNEFNEDFSVGLIWTNSGLLRNPKVLISMALSHNIWYTRRKKNEKKAVKCMRLEMMINVPKGQWAATHL